jgi:hypothetical protein
VEVAAGIAAAGSIGWQTSWWSENAVVRFDSRNDCNSDELFAVIEAIMVRAVCL